MCDDKYKVKIFKRRPEVRDEIVEAIQFDGTIECAKFITKMMDFKNEGWKCEYELTHLYDYGNNRCNIKIKDAQDNWESTLHIGDWVWADARRHHELFNPDYPRRIYKTRESDWRFNNLFEEIDCESELIEEKDIIKFSNYLEPRYLQIAESKYHKEHGD